MALAPANGAQKQLHHGIPIYGLSNPSRETVLADEKSLDDLTTTIIINKLRLRAIDASITNIQDAVDQAKFAAAEHFVAQSAFPSAQLRDGIHNMQPPYLLPPPGFTFGLSTPYFDMGQFLYDLRQYSAFYGGRCVYDVAVLVKSQDPTQPVVLDIYQSQPGRQGTHTLWYIQQRCWIPGAGQSVEMLQALAPSTPPPAPAMPVPPPAQATQAAPAALPAPPPPAHRAIQPRKPHHHSAVPYAGLTADQILAQVHTEHMFGGVILVLYLTYSKGDLMKKLSDKRQQSEGMEAFGPKSQQVVHYRVKNAIEHIFGKANYKANAAALKRANKDRTQAAAWRTRLNDPATYAAATCCRSDDDDADPSSGATLPAQNPAASGPALQASATNNGAASSTPSRAYGSSSQVQHTPARPLMAPESRGQQNLDHSTPAPVSDAVRPSSSPVLLDPALRDNAVPTSPAIQVPAFSENMAPTSPTMPAPALQDNVARNFPRPMEGVQTGAVVVTANERPSKNLEHPVLGASETWFLQWANRQTANEASATPMDVDEPQQPNNEALQSNDAAVSPQESQQQTGMEIEDITVSPGQSPRQAQEQIVDTAMSSDNNQQQTQDQSDDTAVTSDDSQQLIKEQVEHVAVSLSQSPQETHEPIEVPAVSPNEPAPQTSAQLVDSAASSDEPQHQTQEQAGVAISSSEDQKQAQGQSNGTAMSSGEPQQLSQDQSEVIAASPADGQPQTQERSEDTAMISNEIQQQVQEQEPQDNALNDAQDVIQAQPHENPQDDQQQIEQQISETGEPDEPHDLEPDWDYFWDWPGVTFCCGCNGAGRHFDDHEKDCFKLFDPEFQ
ncbi:hypothetical protein CKM354_000024900 [Cercospora kikuchii]|uniref:Uncharacterized protein n=1 Tax=Cercospora kikuchii TaxID=84275 RepID=A0A9P3FAU2_9PEZI|nr:uncharacterized protein CKM354_000024900 [Cercospora kikuchii]GIZ36782.1 hypothetical protein CKM354_000024900 [Cercospora kikuchii]